MTTLAAHLEKYRILLTCGTGGVGKTTIAAALGLQSAMEGRRTLVVTIDPARRLADALGVDLSHAEPTRVWPQLQSPVASFQSPVKTDEVTGDRRPATGDGFLDALMLDTKRTFDRLIERYAPDPATARTVLDNPLYKYLSTLITGSQEYMAMEKLYEMTTEHAYDCIIIDTPPASHAVDFLRGPQRLIRALTDSMLLLFLKPSMIAGKFGAKILAKGADMLMGVFGRLAGAELMQEVADLLMSTVGLFGGFRQRAEAVQALLRGAETAFLLVAAPQAAVIEDALDFVRAARREGLRLGGAVVNRAMPMFTAHPGQKNSAHGELIVSLSNDEPCILRQAQDEQGAQLIVALNANMAMYNERLQSEQRAIARLQSALPRRLPTITVPLCETDITDVEGLRHLAQHLAVG